MDDAAAQIDILRSLAVRGRHGVVNCGGLILVWGAAIIMGAGIEIIENHRVLSAAAWIGPLILAFLASMFIMAGGRSRPHGLTWRTQAIHRVWVASGISILFFNIGEDIHGSQLPSQSEAMTAFSLAVALLVTANVSGQRLYGVAGAAWMFVAFGLLTIIPPHLLLPVLLASGIVLLIVPGCYALSSGSSA